MATIPLYVDGTRMRIDAPPSIAEELKEKLTFTEKIFLQGWEKKQAQNLGEPVVTEQYVQCYSQDFKGRICTDAGFLTPTFNWLKARGYNPETKYIWSADKDRWIFDWDRVNRYYPTLDPDQKALLRMIVEDRWRGGAANLPTGWGKGDIIGALVVGFTKLRIHVIVKGIATIDQRLIPEFSSKFVNFGVRGGKHKTNAGARVMLVSADSLKAVKKDRVDLVLCDEARKLITDSYMGQLVEYHHSIIWGLDATFDKRIDGKNYRRQQMFGDIRFKQTFQQSEEKKRVVPVVVVWHRFRMDVDPAAGIEDDVKAKREMYWRNDLRNQLIARIAKQIHKKGNQSFIATATVEHALNIRKFLPGVPLVYGHGALASDKRRKFINEGLMDEDEPDMTWERVQEVTRKFGKSKISLAIANLVWNYGVSFDDLMETIYASAVQSYESCNQVSGRLTRWSKKRAKKHGIHHDIWDTFSRKSKSAAKARYRVYKDLGYLQLIYDPISKKFVRFLG